MSRSRAIASFVVGCIAVAWMQANGGCLLDTEGALDVTAPDAGEASVDDVETEPIEGGHEPDASLESGGQDVAWPESSPPDGSDEDDAQVEHADEPQEPVCGDGLMEGNEACDGASLGGQTCATLGYQFGDLACAPDCMSIDDAACLSFPADWLDITWAKRARLVVPAAKASSDLMGFPLLVDVSHGEFAARAQSDGDDFVFTTSDGVIRLAYETESYDALSGRLIAWVALPGLPAQSETVLYLYFGNASCSAQQFPTQVWDGDYVSVWHWREPAVDGASSVTHVDSTANGHDGTQGGNQAQPGKIGTGQRFSGGDRVDVLDPAGFVLGNASATLSVWVRTTSTADMMVFVKGPDNHLAGDKLFGLNHTAKKWGHDEGWTGYLNGAPDVTDDAWHHLAWTQEKDVSGANEQWRIYVDGAETGSTTFETKDDPVGATVRIGAGLSGSYFSNPLDATIDELRVSRSARSAAWLEACWSNQNDPAGWVALTEIEGAIHAKLP